MGPVGLGDEARGGKETWEFERRKRRGSAEYKHPGVQYNRWSMLHERKAKKFTRGTADGISFSFPWESMSVLPAGLKEQCAQCSYLMTGRAPTGYSPGS